MTADAFRRFALTLPGASESSHMAHPDFRVGSRIFATLGYPDSRHGMVKLNPVQQAELLQTAPETFQPAAGAWGRSGSTVVLLSAVKGSALAPILRQAWENASRPKPVGKKGPRR